MDMKVTLRTWTRQIDSKSFAVTDSWEEIAHSFVVPAKDYDELIELASAELVLDIEQSDRQGLANCWIDGVRLTYAPEGTPPQDQPMVDVGIVSPMTAAADLSDIWQIGDEVTFGVRLVVYGIAAAIRAGRQSYGHEQTTK